jgi:hypothetical protein
MDKSEELDICANDKKPIQNNEIDHMAGLTYVLMREVDRMRPYDDFFQIYQPTATYSNNKLSISCPTHDQFDFQIDGTDGCVILYYQRTFCTNLARFDVDNNHISIFTINYWISIDIKLESNHMLFEYCKDISRHNCYFPTIFYKRFYDVCKLAREGLADYIKK